MDLWLSKASDRETCQWIFSELASFCRPDVTPLSPGQEAGQKAHALDVTVTITSPLQLGSAPRVMGMTPPQPSYASPTHSETGLDELESSSLVGSAKGECVKKIPLNVTIITSPLQMGSAPRIMGMGPPKPSYASTSHSETGFDEVESSSMDGSAKSEGAHIPREYSTELILRRRMRHILIEWSVHAAKQRQTKRHAALIFRRSERATCSETLAVYFICWNKRKCQIAWYATRMQTARRRAVLDKSIVVWSQFLREQWSARKIGRKLYFQAARAILHTWSMYVDEQVKTARVSAVFAMRSHHGRMLLNLTAWVKWVIRQNKRCDFDLALQQRQLVKVFGVWKGRLLKFRHELTISTAYERIREGTIIRSSFRSWYCNSHLSVNLRKGFQEQVLAMSTLFLSDQRTQRLQNELLQRKGRARALKACEAFATEISLSAVQKVQRDAFESWRTYRDWKSSGREFYERVLILLDTKLMQTFLFSWARDIGTKKRNAEVIFRILVRWNRSLKWQILATWSLCVRTRSQVHHKMASFRGRANRRVKNAILLEWKTVSDFKDLLIRIAEVMDSKLLRRACAAWHGRLVDELIKRKKVWRASLLIRRGALKDVIAKWHSRVLTQLARHGAVAQMLQTVMKGKLWVATLSWRNYTRIIASGKSKAHWLFAQLMSSTTHRTFWTWTQFCRTCRDSEATLVRAQGRRMAQTAQEALERTTLLEWLYRQQFKSLYRVRMQRAAVLVQRKRLRQIFFLWRSAVDRKYQHCKIVFALCSKTDGATLSAHFGLWHEYTYTVELLEQREEQFTQRCQRRKVKHIFLLFKASRSSKKSGSAIIQNRHTDKTSSFVVKQSIWLHWKFTAKSRRTKAAYVMRAARLIRKRRTKMLFTVWNERAYASKNAARVLQKALNLQRRQLLYSFLLAWAQTTKERRMGRINGFRAYKMMFRHTMATIVETWRENTRLAGAHKKVMRTLVNKYQNSALYHTTIAWKEHMHEKRLRRHNSERGAASIFRRILKHILFMWHDNVRIIRTCTHLMQNLINRTQHSSVHACFVEWAVFVDKKQNQERNAEMGANVVFSRLLRDKLFVWRDSARNAKNSTRILRTIRNKLYLNSLFFAFRKWATYVGGMSQQVIKLETTAWIFLTASFVDRNERLLVNTMHMWKDRQGRIKTFVESSAVGATFKSTFCTINSSFSAWQDFIRVQKQNAISCGRIEMRRSRNLQKYMFETWVSALDEIEELEFNAARWDEWRGPVPEWYAESLVAVLQQRMTSSAKILRAWSGLLDDCRSIVATFHKRRQDNSLRRTLTQWKYLQVSKRSFNIDSGAKEDCLARRNDLHLMRDAKRVWVAYTSKYFVLRLVSFVYAFRTKCHLPNLSLFVSHLPTEGCTSEYSYLILTLNIDKRKTHQGGMSVDCTFRQRLAFVQGHFRNCPDAMQRRMTAGKASVLRRCVDLIHYRQVRSLADLLADWKKRSSAKCRRLHVYNIRMQRSEVSLLRRTFGALQVYVI